MAMRKARDAGRKALLAHDDVPTGYRAWMVSDGTVEHLIEVDSDPDAERKIRAVAKRLGPDAEVFEVTGKTTTRRALAAVAAGGKDIR